MIRWLASISPVAVLLIGALPSLAIGWGAREAKFAWLDRPAIVREATTRANDAATIRIMDAANKAEQATRQLLERQHAEALRIYRSAVDANQQIAADAATKLQEGIAAYEAELAAAGLRRPVTQRDIDWVRGNNPPR